MTKFTMKCKKTSNKDNAKRKQKSEDDGCCSSMANLIFLICITFGLACFHQYKFVYPKHFHFKDGTGAISIRHFASDLNTVMCQAYEVTSGEPADVFLVPGIAKIDYHKRNIIKSLLFPGSFGDDKAFYLLEGSDIKVNACKVQETFESTHSVAIMLFKGDDSWDEWKSGKCTDCQTEKRTLSDRVCEEGASTVVSYHVEDRDSYYVTVTNSDRYETPNVDVRAELEVEQTTFDTTHALQRCYMSEDCVFNLTYASDVDVVMKFGDQSTFNSFTSDCKFRVIFWVGIFAIFPACLIALCFVFCAAIMYCDRVQNNETMKGKMPENVSGVITNDKISLVKNVLPLNNSTTEHAGSDQVV